MVEGSELPREDVVDGFRVYRPKALYIPLTRGAINARLYQWSARSTFENLCASYKPRFVWASFAFPDGVAVAHLANRVRLRFVISLLGSDINSSLDDRARRGAIVESLQRASLVLAKSQALKDIVVSLGVSAEKICLDYNGVDTDIFKPRDRDEACRTCGVDIGKRRILFVGNFVEVKDVLTLLRTFTEMLSGARREDDLELVLIGTGPLKRSIRKWISEYRIQDRVIMAGALPHDEVAQWMAASDVLCLPSKNEGVPNVVLEAFASGIPVVASRVGGIPEIHPGNSAGGLFERGDTQELAYTLRRTLSQTWDRGALSSNAGSCTWKKNAHQLKEVFDRMLLNNIR